MFLHFTMEAIMLIFGIVAGVFGAGLLCWVLFKLAVFALPFFAGVSAGLAALHAGSGAIGAIGVGLTAGVVVLAAGQPAFTLTASMFVRVGVATLFAVPAAAAGYHATHGLAGLATTSPFVRQAIGTVGSLIVGATALARLTPIPRGSTATDTCGVGPRRGGRVETP